MTDDPYIPPPPWYVRAFACAFWLIVGPVLLGLFLWMAGRFGRGRRR